MKTAKPSDEKPAENFRKAMRKILSVPKKEIERREAEYRKGRGLEKPKK